MKLVMFSFRVSFPEGTYNTYTVVKPVAYQLDVTVRKQVPTGPCLLFHQHPKRNDEFGAWKVAMRALW